MGDSPYSACAAPSPEVKPTHIGGQAVIEGVMMRGKHNWVVSARDTQGVIHSEEHDLTSAAAHNEWMRWPIVRGVVALVESLVLGTKALTASAMLAGLEEEGEEELSSGAMVGAVIGGAVLAIGIFVALPWFVTRLIVGMPTENPFLWNAVNGLCRITAFFLYIWLIGFVPDLKRVFMYHGAEHKVLHALEHGDELTVENAQRYPTLHVRCGTAFLLMVMIISILVFALFPIKALVAAWGVDAKWLISLISFSSHILLMPVVAGLAYEFTVKWAGPRADKLIVKILLWPGLQMQRFTTAEPTDDMVEVAIVSTKAVVARERRELGLDQDPITAEYDLLDDII